MKDVATRAGVSAMTVSRVVNGGAGVDWRTRVAVADAIRVLGYTAKVASPTPQGHPEPRIGLIYSDADAPHIASLLRALFEASPQGLRLVVLTGYGGKGPDRAQLEKFVGLGGAGFVVLPPVGDSQIMLALLGETGLPVVAIGAYAVESAICVRVDDRRAAEDMTRHLIELGHRELGFIMGSPDQAASAERLAGFHAAVRRAGDVEVVVAQGDSSFDSGLAAAETLLDADPRPSAIFASNDDMAAGILWAAHARHITVPRALTVVGFDDSTAALMLSPRLTTVHQPVRDLASEALRLLVARLAGEAEPAGQRGVRVLEHSIVRRQSTSVKR